MQRSEREALRDGLNEIDRLITELDLDSTVRERTTEIYRKVMEAKNESGDNVLLQGRGVQVTSSSS